jgi:hypothetical protein
VRLHDGRVTLRQGVHGARPPLGRRGRSVHHAQAEQGRDGQFGARTGLGAGEASDEQEVPDHVRAEFLDGRGQLGGGLEGR